MLSILNLLRDKHRLIRGSIRDCSEFLVRGGVVLFGKSARKKRIPPPLGVTVKFWYPPLESLSKMGSPPPR